MAIRNTDKIFSFLKWTSRVKQLSTLHLILSTIALQAKFQFQRTIETCLNKRSELSGTDTDGFFLFTEKPRLKNVAYKRTPNI